LGAAIASNISYAAGTILYLLLYSKITGVSLKKLFSFQQRDILVLKDYLDKIIRK